MKFSQGFLVVIYIKLVKILFDKKNFVSYLTLTFALSKADTNVSIC